MHRCWEGFNSFSVLNRLQATAETLSLWGRKADSEFRLRKKELEHTIESCQARGGNLDIEKLKDSRVELGKLLIQEES